MKDLISVLIPIYNGLHYLPKTVESLLAQSYKNFEVICIDDFSTDGSLEFIENLSQKDSRFKIYKRTSKGGTAVAGLKYGLPFCSGEYFFYMSQDDFVDKKCFEILYKKAVETGADAVVPNMIWYYGEKSAENKLIKPPKDNYNAILTGKEAFELALPWEIHGFYLRRTELLKKIGYDDSFFTGCEYNSRTYLHYANKVVFADTNFYYRQDNPNAIIKTFKPRTIEDVLGYIKLLHFMKQNNYSRSFRHVWFKNTVNLLGYYKNKVLENYQTFSSQEADMCKIKLNLYRNELVRFALHNGKIHSIARIYRKSKITQKMLRNTSKPFVPLPFYGKCIVGKNTYSAPDLKVENSKTKIGSFVSIAGKVTIGQGEHPVNYLSTSPYFYMSGLGWTNRISETYANPCTIGNDVWIGQNVFIRQGITVGDGAVIGAGAVVVKDVPAYAVVGGVPAKVIKYRFDDETIKELLALKWWNLPDEEIKKLPFKDIKATIAMLKKIRHGK
ncbi:glycosyltransferase [Endomicrobium proavitum]|nr:glycosyltransferase [Endomicrobium proavitum]